MKNILLLIASVLTGMTLSAQANYFEFVDKDGNVVPDGTTLTLTEVTSEEDVFGEVTDIMYTNLSVRNTSNAERYMRVNLFIERIDNGKYQFCFPGACKEYESEDNVLTEAGTLAAGETKDLKAEWIPYDIGGMDVTLTIEVLNKNGANYTYVCDGPTVTLHYRNGIQDEVPGDVNGDGEVGIDDVNAAINIMLGKTETVDTADLNGDGEVGIDDVNAIINLMLGK